MQPMRLMLFFLFCLCHAICFANKHVQTGKAPSWVKTIEIPNEKPSEENGSAQYLLVDFQNNLIEKTNYTHFAIQVLNAEGVQENSDLTINFDPTFQRLKLHTVRIIRDGKTFSKLNQNKIKVIQLESRKEASIYDGSLSAIIHLDDVRVNDIIEYAYTRKGWNPLNKENYAGSFYQQYSSDVSHIYNRIITKDKNDLEFKYINNSDKPNVIEKKEHVEFIWNIQDPEHVNYDNHTPSWYNIQKRVLFSTFDTWAEVANWAEPLYVYNDNKMSDMMSQFQMDLPKKELISDIIDFVQDDIRYLGLEAGISAYKPSPPSEVFQRKFGDCKDKSLLMVALLRSIDVEAWPILVNTEIRQELLNRQPAHNVFDHCVVHFKHDEKAYFVDPTISNQGGNIDNIFFPPYTQGLVIRKNENELTPIPSSQVTSIDIDEVFHLGSIGKGGHLRIETKYAGSKADNMRAYFSTNTREYIKKEYLDYYSVLYPNIEQAEELVIVEDEESPKNEFTIIEEYVIQDLWDKEDSSLIFFELYPLVLEGIINYPNSAKRDMPYYLGRPHQFTQSTTVNFPEVWAVEDESVSIDHPAFNYTNKISGKGKTIEVVHKYEQQTEILQAEEVGSFFKKVEKVQENLPFFVTYDYGALVFKLSYLSVLLAMVSLGVGLWLAMKLHKTYSPLSKADDTNMPIQGWLILPAIGITLTPLFLLPDLFSPDFYNANNWDGIMQMKEGKRVAFALLVSLELVYNWMFFVLSILLLIQFYQKRTSVPRLASIFYFLSFSFPLIDVIIAESIQADLFEQDEMYETYKSIGKSFITAVIWIPYFNMSSRVKKTFCKQYSGI